MKTNYSLKSTIVFALFIVSLFTFQAKADAIVINDIAYTLDDEALTAETAARPDGEKYKGDLVIPASVSNDGKTYNVIKIGDGSLRDAPELTSVTIPDGLQTIGNSAFASCTALTSVTVPASVNSIEDWAFYECSALSGINIPDGIKAIGEHVFQKAGLTSITLPSSVTSLKTCAFQEAEKLASINIENVTEIGGWALFGTAITSVTIGNVFNISSEAFNNCTQLTNLTFSGNVITIGDWAFQNIGVTNLVLPASLVNLGGGAFADCINLTSVTIPKGVKSLKDWAFSSSPMEEIFVSWDNLAGISVSENAFGNVTGTPEWKVPAELKDLYGDIWNGFPVSARTTGINSTLNEDIKVYYNNGILNFTNMAGFNASIISVGGQKIAGFQVNDENGQIPVSLAKGVYLLNAKNANNQTTIKFIVK